MSRDESQFFGCEAPEEYFAWVQKHLTELDLEEPIAINQEILLVTLKYHEWYSQVTEIHRVRVGRRGHECIFHVFMMALDTLIEAKTKLNPPVYFPPPTPLSPDVSVTTQIAGIFLGEEIEE